MFVIKGMVSPKVEVNRIFFNFLLMFIIGLRDLRIMIFIKKAKKRNGLQNEIEILY